MPFLPQLFTVIIILNVNIPLSVSNRDVNNQNINQIVIQVNSIKISVIDEESGEPEIVEKIKNSQSKITLGKGAIQTWTLPFHLTNQLRNTKLHSLEIECSSNDIVSWDYKGNGILPNLNIENSRLVTDYWNTSTYRYSSKIVITTFTEQLTGEYVCKGVGKSNMQNSFRLFSPRDQYIPFPIGSVIRTTKQEILQSEIFPCRIHNLSKTLELYERNYDGDLEAVEFAESIKFDPYLGFRIYDIEYVSRFMESESRYFCFDVSSGKAVLAIKIQEMSEDDYENEERGPGAKFTITKDRDSSIFTCRSNSSIVPNIIFTEINSTGCLESTILQSTAPFHIEEDCGEGCRKIRTNRKNLVATCVGDGIKETIPVPSASYCIGRPFLIQRREEMSVPVARRQKNIIVPCIANSHSAVVYLYRESVQKNGLPKLMDDKYFEYNPQQGFILNTTLLPYPCGTYICTSNVDLNDTSDSLTVHLRPISVGNFEPEEFSAYGLCPMKFKWRAREQLIVKERKMGISSFRYDFSHLDTYPYMGAFELLHPKGNVGEIHLVRRRNRKLAHTWRYHCIKNHTVLASGLTASTIYDISGEVALTYISVKCQSKSNIKPTLLTTVYCSNENSCSLAKKNSERIIKFPVSRPHSDSHEQESCGQGCTSIQFLAEARPEFPFRQVLCFGEGVDSANQFATVDLFATGESAIWKPIENNNNNIQYLSLRTESDNDKPWENNPNLQWELGESVSFECKSVGNSRIALGKNFLWAVQFENGTMKFLEDTEEVEDEGVTMTGKLEIEFDDIRIKRLWCFAPLQKSLTGWANASYPITIRNSNENLNCDSQGLELRLVRIAPLPEKILSITDNRLDTLKYFVVSPTVTNLDIEVISSEPIVWTFTSYWNKHTFTIKGELTPRSTLELFRNEIHTNCYSSKLKLEIEQWKSHRSFNTGLLSVYYVHQPWRRASVYLFFPGNGDQFLLNSGVSLSLPVSVREDVSITLPCLVNNPNAKISLLKKSSENVFQKVPDENVIYDPQRGFKLVDATERFNSSHSFPTYKCVSDSKSSDEIEIRLIR